MKKIYIFAAAIAVMSLFITGCQTTKTEGQTQVEAPEKEDKTEKKQSSKKETKEEKKEETPVIQEPQDPPNVAFVKNLQKLLAAGKTEEAIALFQELPDELKDDVELKMLLASLYISVGKYSEANEVAHIILAIDPQNIDALELLTLSARSSGDTKQYKIYAKQVLDSDPFNVQVNIMQGEDYALNRKYKLAKDAYAKALKTEPENADALYGFAQMNYYLDDLKTAKNSCLQLLDSNPQNAAALAFMGKISSEENNNIKAIKYVQESIAIDPYNYNSYMDLGKYYRNTGSFSKAYEAWDKAVELNPDYFLAYAFLAGCYDEQGVFDMALYNYHKVIETNPKYYYAYESAAVLEYHSGNYNEARRLFDIAYSYSANYSYKLLNAAMYFKEGDFFNGKKVINALLKTLTRDSAEYNLVRLYGETYSRNAETTLITQINKEDNGTKRGKMLFYLGLYYEVFGSQEAAAEYYSKVTKMQAPMFFEYRLAEWGLGL